jgi:hypothetical protein
MRSLLPLILLCLLLNLLELTIVVLKELVIEWISDEFLMTSSLYFLMLFGLALTEGLVMYKIAHCQNK